MKKVLITGASGFIGSFLVEEALNKGWEIWAGVRQSSNREFLIDERIRFIDLKYLDFSTLKEQLMTHAKEYGKWDYIIHNAGVTKCLDPHDFERINYTFTRNLIDVLQETKTVPEKFVLMSSFSAYPNPQTIYGKSKLKAERFLQRQPDFPFIILRPTGVYGPREKDYFLMVKSIYSGLNATAGFKPQLLTFIYVKDLVKAAYLALESQVCNTAYNVADGLVYSDKDFIRIVKRILEKKYILNIKLPLFVLKAVSVVAEDLSKLTKKPSTLNRDKYKIMAQRDWTCDTLPIRQDLGFCADYDLERGLQETIMWYKDNKWL